MKTFKISSTNIFKGQNEDEATLNAALDSLDLKNRLKGIKKVFIKINLVVAEDYRLGSVSDPFILEGIVKEIKKNSDAEVVITEAETAWCTEAFLPEASEKREDLEKGWKLALKESGTQELLDKYGLRVLNITTCEKAPKEEVETKVKTFVGDNFNMVDTEMLEMVPAEFMDEGIFLVDYAKLKSHRFIGAGNTAACKNLFGFITTPNRVPFHDGGKGLINSLLSINLIYSSIFNNKVALVESLRFAIEGDGPDTEAGITKKDAGLIVTGENFLEVDAVATYLMGYDFKYTSYLQDLEPAYPNFEIDYQSIPEELLTPYKLPEHWEGKPNW